MGKKIVSALVLGFFGMNTVGHANIVGVGSQNFNTIPSGLDFVTVHSSETLKPGIINSGLFLNYAINSLPYFDETEASRLKFKDGILFSDFNFALGLMRGWDFGASFPVLISQNKSDTGFRGEFSKPGMTEIRLLTKVRFLGNDSRGLGLVLSSNFNLIRNDPMAGLNPGPTYNFEIVGDTTWGPVSVGANLGYRKRNSGSAIAGFPIEPLGDQVIASVAASYLVDGIDTKVIGEIYTGFPTGSQIDLSSRNNSASELIAGLKHDFSHELSAHFGMGTELLHARSSPDWRLYSGVNYVFGYDAKASTYTYDSDGREVIVVTNIRFKFDSEEMTQESQDAVQELVGRLQSSKNFKMLSIEGHTDSIGPDAYNKSLSLRRADAIKKYLVAVHGFAKEKVDVLGVGEERPIADNGNFQGRQANRRVEFKIER